MKTSSSPRMLPTVWCCLAVTATSVSAQTDLPPPMRPEVLALIEAYETDAPYANVERWMKVEKELATRPDIKQDLMNDLKRSLIRAGQTPGKVVSPRSMSALTLRADLTADEQKLITDEMVRVMDITHKDGINIEGLFLGPAIHLLSHYPSSEHEALLLRLLEHDDRQDYTLVDTFRTLSVIGSQKALEVMRQMAARFQAKNRPQWLLKEMSQHIGTLETRLKQEAATGQSQSASVAASSPQNPPAPSVPITATTEPPAISTSDWRVWLALLGGLILVIALSCRVFRRKE